MAYTSEANVEALLGITITDSTTPTSTQVTTLISWADAWIDSYTGRKYAKTGITDEIYASEPTRDFLSGDEWEGSPVLFLDHWPIIAMTLQRNTGSAASPSWEELTEDTDFTVDKKTGRVDFHQNKPQPIKRAVKVTYDYGVSSVPSEIAYLSTILVGLMVLMAKQGSVNIEDVSSIALGDLRIDFGQDASLATKLKGERDFLLNIIGKQRRAQ